MRHTCRRCVNCATLVVRCQCTNHHFLFARMRRPSETINGFNGGAYWRLQRRQGLLKSLHNVIGRKGTLPIGFVVPERTAIPFARLRQVGTRGMRGIVAAATTLASSSANNRQVRLLANWPRRGTTSRHAINVQTPTRQFHRDRS